jgi:hypothetical protein
VIWWGRKENDSGKGGNVGTGFNGRKRVVFGRFRVA